MWLEHRTSLLNVVDTSHMKNFLFFFCPTTVVDFFYHQILSTKYDVFGCLFAISTLCLRFVIVFVSHIRDVVFIFHYHRITFGFIRVFVLGCISLTV